MFLRAICAFLVLAVASAEPQKEDTTQALAVTTNSPGSGDSFKVTCTFDPSKSGFTSLTKLRLVTQSSSEDKRYNLLAAVNKKKVSYGTKSSGFVAHGQLGKNGKASDLEVTWDVGSQAGYCKLYKCVVTGSNPTNKKVSIYRTLDVPGTQGQACGTGVTPGPDSTPDCSGIEERITNQTSELMQIHQKVQMYTGLVPAATTVKNGIETLDKKIDQLSAKLDTAIAEYPSKFKDLWAALDAFGS